LIMLLLPKQVQKSCGSTIVKKIIVKSLFETLLYLQPQSNPDNKKGN